MQFFCLINGTPHNVPAMKFRVDGEECAIVGTWHNGKPYAPNKAQFRAALPYRWRKAFDRECQGTLFWHGDNSCNVTLSNARGADLATIYCIPIKES